MFGGIEENIDTILKEKTALMDLSVLFNVFYHVLKCPDCGSDMNSYVDMKKKNGYSNYIVLEYIQIVRVI